MYLLSLFKNRKEYRFLKIAGRVIAYIENRNIKKARHIVENLLNPIFISLALYPNKKQFPCIVVVHEDIFDLLRESTPVLLTETKKDLEIARKSLLL